MYKKIKLDRPILFQNHFQSLFSDSQFRSVILQILAIVTFSQGPISTYTEIHLLDRFNQTYLSNSEETFYNYLDIEYRYLEKSGNSLFAEGTDMITSEYTQFTAIDYSRNPDMTNNYHLIGYGSELFDHFEIYQDESSIIYTADIDMDGEPDYKQTIDVDRDGTIDIIRYGIDDPQGSGEIYWYTVIQHFESSEVSVKQELDEKKSTEWFDINDRAFAQYDFNVMKLIIIALSLPLLPYHITKMFLPDVDYWAQKSTQTLMSSEEYVHSEYYSVKVDEDRDGIPDSQISYDATEVEIYYEITEYRETMLAAKLQNIFTYLGEYVIKSISSLFTGSYEDPIFNEDLTKKCLETGDFSSCNGYTQANAKYLTSTYRKFTENITTIFIDRFEQSSITVIDFDDEGGIVEQRTYIDDFDNDEIGNTDELFSDFVQVHSVTNLDTGQQNDITFDPELPFSHPANISWQEKTWGPDNIPVKYDSLQVAGENYFSSSNVFEKTIILRIPNRYSLYHDYKKSSQSQVADEGWVEFEVEGIFITPPDGRVYYTSDVDLFIAGEAKTKGHYFYVDSDNNGFFETVYILSNTYVDSGSSIPAYNVMSIGLNYDGKHDFIPYEKIDSTIDIASDFSTIAGESTMFGSDWVYNFGELKDVSLLWEQETVWDEYRPMDQIFEIHKLVEMSDKNSKFTELFYQVRHEAYTRAWEQYKKQLVKDVAQQVFMSVTASVLSAFVKTTLSAIPIVGVALAEIAAPLTYFAVYCLLTKFYIDLSIHEAESQMRAETYYPVTSNKRDPVSLNEKGIGDRILGDSMAAGLIGHPGGYYTEVSGGESGNMYTAQLLVSPPNLARMYNSFGGFLELLWENFWTMGESDPDVFYALDFDDLNLDFLLFTSELPAFNQHSYYTYENTEGLDNWYAWYWANTLGYLESKVNTASGGVFDAIRPTCINGRPQYEFVNKTIYETVLPESVLYRPIILSQERYDKLNPDPGHLIVQVQCKDYGNTEGINAYELDSIETQAGYKAKVPINDNGFEYPIQYISIDVLKVSSYHGPSYFAQNIIISEADYAIDSGNLYFTRTLEEIIAESYEGFDDILSSLWANELIDSKVFYKIHIVFDLFVPDTTEETNTLALAQATFYTFMDYFNQYTYAEVTANMISEIAYTETVTFWSTLISAPLVFLGSWTVMGTETLISQAGASSVKALLYSTVKSFITAPIKEVFEEIIKDGFTEALIENVVEIVGLTEDVGFWLSSMATSWRETSGALAELSALGQGAGGFKNLLSIIKSGDTDARIELMDRFTQNLGQQQDTDLQAQEQKKSWQKLLTSGFFRGLSMVMSTLYFGGFNYLALRSLNNLYTDVKPVSSKSYGEYKARQYATRKAELNQILASQPALAPESVLINNMKKQMKKPADIDSEALNRLFRGQQETDVLNTPTVDISILFNANPQIDQRNELAKRFNTITLSTYFSEWIQILSQDERFQSYKEDFKNVEDNYKEIGVQKAEKEIISIIKEALSENGNINLRFVNMFGTEFYDPQFILLGITPGQDQFSGMNDPYILDYDFKTFKSTIEIVEKLKDIYSINKFHPQLKGVGDIDLELYVLKNKDMFRIPIDKTTNLADWLDDNGFSKDDKIIVLPSYIPTRGKPLFEKGIWKTKDEGGSLPSPFYPAFKEMVIDLGCLFENLGKIRTDSSIVGIERYRLKLASLLGDYNSILSQTALNLQNGNEFLFRPFILDTLKIKFEGIISDEPDNVQKRENMVKLNEIFDKIYLITGHASKYIYQTKTRLALQKLALYFKVDHINSLIDIIGHKRPNEYYLKGLEKSPRSIESTIDRFVLNPINYILRESGYNDIEVTARPKFIEGLNSILDNTDKSFEEKIEQIENSIYIEYFAEVDKEIDRETEEKVEGLIEIAIPHLREVVGYWITEGLFKDYGDSMKKELFKRIVLAGNLYEPLSASKGVQFSNTKLSLLIFSSSSAIKDHLTKLENNEVDPAILQRIKFSVMNWDIDSFKKITGKDFTKFELVIRQDAIVKEIDNWVLEKNLIDKSLIKYEKGRKYSFAYEALTNIIFAATLKKAKDSGVQSFEKVKPIYSNRELEIMLGTEDRSMQSFYSGKATQDYISLIDEKDTVKKLKARETFKRNIEKIYNTLKNWHEEEFGTRKTGLKYVRTDPLSHQRLYYYQQALYSIYKFVKSSYDLTPSSIKSATLVKKDYFLDFPSPTVASMTLIQAYEKTGKPPLPTEFIANGYDFDYWSSKINYAFQKIFHLCKLRGFDPFFRPLQDGEILDRHHFRIFAFRKMSSDINDFIMTTQSWHKKDFEQLFKEMGPQRAEAFVEALIKTMEELNNLKDENGDIKEISEQDLINALKHNFGAEWRDVYNQILEKNDNNLKKVITEWNNRGLKIQSKGYSGFIKSDFRSVFEKNFKLIRKIQLTQVLGIIASKEDFIIFDKLLPGILPLPQNFAKINNFI